MAEETGFPLTRLQKKFQEFREKGIFIDCSFVLPGGEVVKAHRLILAKYSSTFKNYFRYNNINDASQVLEIPFITDAETFKKVIDFFYTGFLEIEPSSMILLMATSYMLGVESLKAIVSDFVHNNINTDHILSFTRPFLDFKVDEEKAKIYPDLYDNFNELVEGSKFISDQVAKRFHDLNPESVCRSVPAYMLAHILMNIDSNSEIFKEFSSENDFKISMIDTFVGDKELEMKDRISLTEVINWEVEDAYLFFSNHECNWVTPNIARKMISTLLTKRRQTALANAQAVEKMPRNTVHHFAAYQLIQMVVNSRGESECPFYDIIQEMSTLFGSVKMFNPELYRLVMPSIYTQPPMTTNFPIANIFVNDTTYYLTQSSYYEDPETGNYPTFSCGVKEWRNNLTAGINFETSENSMNAFLQIDTISVVCPKHLHYPLTFSMRETKSQELFKFDGEIHKNPKFDSNNKLIESDASAFIENKIPVDMINITAENPFNTNFSLGIRFIHIHGRFLL